MFTEIRECALEERDQVNKANMPSKPLTRINQRHFISRISKRSLSDAQNTMILPGYEDAIEADRRMINDGRAKRANNDYVINGRTYREHGGTGTFYPVSGEGVINIDRGAHRALVILKTYNESTDAALNRLKHERDISDEQVGQALQLWSLRTK